MFSLVIPVYNTGRWFCPCLESIQQQSFHAWEAILIDDGCTDGSEIVCDQICNTDERFKVIHQDNRGISTASNIGMDLASEKWIWCIDSDDLVHRRALEIHHSVIEYHPESDVVIHDLQTEDNISFPQKLYDDLKSFLEHLEFSYPEMSQFRCIFKKSFYPFVHFYPPLHLGMDLLFCAELLNKAKNIIHIGLPLYKYVYRETSVMHSDAPRKYIKDSILWMSKILTLYGNDESGHFRHVERTRWNTFLFVLPMRIYKYSKNKQKELLKIWFMRLKEIPLVHLQIWEKTFVQSLICVYSMNYAVGFFYLKSIILLYKGCKFIKDTL